MRKDPGDDRRATPMCGTPHIEDRAPIPGSGFRAGFATWPSGTRPATYSSADSSIGRRFDPNWDLFIVLHINRRFSSWVLGSLFVMGAGRVWATDAAPNEEAKRAFSAGVLLLKDPDGAKYEDALTQFNKAYSLSGSWKVLGNIGLCSLTLERDGETITAYEKYLAQGGKEIDADEHVQ